MVTPQTPLLEAGQLLVDHRVDSLPVVNNLEDQQVLGKLTKTHLVDCFVRALVSEENL